MTLKKTIRILIISLMAMVAVLFSAAAVMADDGDTTAPLDLSNATKSEAGDGWQWDNNQKILTLENLKMDLTAFTEKYDAAIKLPEGASVIVNGNNVIKMKDGSRQNEEFTNRIAVYADGTLQIGGSGVLDVTAEEGAWGICSDGDLVIGEENIEIGPSVEVYATDLAIDSDETVVIQNATVEAGTTGKKSFGAIVAGNDSGAGTGLTVNDSDLTLSVGGNNAVGMITGGSNMWIEDSSVSQTPVKGVSNAAGITVVGGTVGIISSQVYLDLGYGKKQGDSLITAAYGSADFGLEKNIYIKDSTIRGMNADEGLSAGFGGVAIDGSTIDVTTTGCAIDCTYNGLQIINNSNVKLLSKGDYYSAAARVSGPLEISDSKFRAVAEGSCSGGLVVNDGNEAVINGKDTSLYLKGEMAALELHGRDLKSPSPLILNDGLYAAKGGKLQSVKDEGELTWSYSASKLKLKDGDLTNASKVVLINSLKRNTLKATGKTVTVKYAKLKKKAQIVTKKKAYSITGAQGKVTYKLKGVVKAKFKKYFKVNAKTGAITVKKGLKKGSYTVKVNVTASGNKTYNPATKTANVKVKVR